MDIHFINYPHGVNLRDFVRVTWMSQHTLDTISTYANCFFGQKSEKCAHIETTLHTRWTQLMDTTDGNSAFLAGYIMLY